jgi:hypothetical protein
MKVVCVTHDYNGPWSSGSVERFIKIGELYDVIENFDDERGNYYQVTLSNGFYGFVNLSKHYFKRIDKIREEKLNELGI